MRNEYPLLLPGGTRVVHAAVDLRGPVPLFVRGVLVVLLDAAVLAALWFLAEVGVGGARRRGRGGGVCRAPSGSGSPPPSARSSSCRRSASRPGASPGWPRRWSGAAICSSPRRCGTRPSPAGGSLRGGGRRRRRAARELSRRIDADLALYQGGRLAGTEHAGAGGSRRHAAADGSRGLRRARARGRARGHPGRLDPPACGERVGYRVVQPGFPAALGVLATPQLAEDASLAVRRLDLALVLLLATLVGVAAALAGAGPRVARAVPAGGRAAPLGARAREGRRDAARMRAARRWSSSRCSAPSSGWRPTFSSSQTRTGGRAEPHRGGAGDGRDRRRGARSAGAGC